MFLSFQQKVEQKRAIEEFCELSELSQSALADVFGVTPACVSQWKSGKNGMPIFYGDFLYLACEVLRIAKARQISRIEYNGTWHDVPSLIKTERLEAIVKISLCLAKDR